MKVKLTGLDRAMIPQIVPPEGDLLQQQIIKELMDLVVIKPGEYDEYKIIRDGSRIMWNGPEILNEKEFDLSKPAIQVLKDAVDQLDKQKRINPQILETCLRIKKL